MRSININILQAVSTLVAAGEITIPQLKEAIAEKRGLNMPCGAARDDHGHFYSFFVATEKEDRTKARRSEDQARIKFNLRAQGVKKQQAATTPGNVLPVAQEGVPELTKAQLQAVAAFLQSKESKVSVPWDEPKSNPADFSELNEPSEL